MRRSVVYTRHFRSPCTYAAHYTVRHQPSGPPSRARRGQGARLTQVQRAAGGTWRVASVEPRTTDRETQLKGRGATRRCPVCITERAMKLIAQWQAEQEPEAGS